jgi:hypothetical protein
MSDQDVIEPTGKSGARGGGAPDGMRPAAFLKCVFVRRRHDYVNSKSRPGHLTCLRCRFRRPFNMS